MFNNKSLVLKSLLSFSVLLNASLFTTDSIAADKKIQKFENGTVTRYSPQEKEKIIKNTFGISSNEIKKNIYKTHIQSKGYDKIKASDVQQGLDPSNDKDSKNEEEVTKENWKNKIDEDIDKFNSSSQLPKIIDN